MNSININKLVVNTFSNINRDIYSWLASKLTIKKKQIIVAYINSSDGNNYDDNDNNNNNNNNYNNDSNQSYSIVIYIR